MCGLVDDAFSFVKDSIGEVVSHPLQALGAAAGVPGYDPFFGGLFNKDALISPTGNFTSSAWNDMYNANPSDSGALGMFHSINDVADKVAPAIAGYYGGPLLSGAASAEGGAGAAAPAFTTGLEGAGTTGGLESGLGGAAMFGPSAGTGVALGPTAAQGLGAGGLGIAGGDALGGTVGSTYGSALGGTNVGTGLGTGAALPAGGSTPLSGGAVSAEGGQTATGAGAMPGQGLGPTSFEGAGTGGGEQGGGNLSALYGTSPDTGGTISAGSPTGQVLGQTSGGVSPALTSSSTAGATGGAVDPNTLQGLFKLFNTGMNFWQQRQQQASNSNYANSIKDIFSPGGAYAQQMQQTLARQDAAQGRNSQYGNRAVELAARLAQGQSQALGNSNYANAATSRPGMNALNSLFSNFGNPQGIKQLEGLYSTASPYVQQGFGALSNLFS